MRSRKDHLIDAQLLTLHRAIADKLQLDKSLLDTADHLISQRAKSGRLSRGNHIAWMSLIEQLRTTQNVADILLKDNEEMRRLLRVSPLGNLLTESEREQAFAHAAGAQRADDIF
ncbi:hypothetical protein [Aestuariibacter salexigens]|uniref:hypothetical protein n=1 Tax=Aestuariibacter salexigens TaxID=226010 RepID=UPI0003FEE063|nr:hypothetical protein [Aestuariibacter salexigens]